MKDTTIEISIEQINTFKQRTILCNYKGEIRGKESLTCLIKNY